MITTPGGFTIKLSSNGRACGDCQLCCRLLPVPTVNDKPANTRCEHQRHGKGCNIYARRPFACQIFSCIWLTADDAQNLRRPDRSHYVIDPAPEFLRLTHNDTGERYQIPVVQIWCDPKHPDAHRDPALRAWLELRARDGFAAIVRYGQAEGFGLFPPSMSSDGQWHEKTGSHEAEHSTEDIFRVISALRPTR